jgi:hypothetical protein
LGPTLESDDEVVGVVPDDHVARVVPTPGPDPESEHVVQVDVVEQGEMLEPYGVPAHAAAPDQAHTTGPMAVTRRRPAARIVDLLSARDERRATLPGSERLRDRIPSLPPHKVGRGPVELDAIRLQAGSGGGRTTLHD